MWKELERLRIGLSRLKQDAQMFSACIIDKAVDCTWGVEMIPAVMIFSLLLSTLCVNLFRSNFSISVSSRNSKMILSGLFIDLCWPLYWPLLVVSIQSPFTPSIGVIQTCSADHLTGQRLFGRLSSSTLQGLVETLLAWLALKSSTRLRAALLPDQRGKKKRN